MTQADSVHQAVKSVKLVESKDEPTEVLLVFKDGSGMSIHNNFQTLTPDEMKHIDHILEGQGPEDWGDEETLLRKVFRREFWRT